MSRDQLSDDGTPAVDTDALGAWVAETAKKKGVSERELLDEILSSYWVLEELSDVVLNGDPTAEGSDHRRANMTPHRNRQPGRRPRIDRHSRPTGGNNRPTT